MQNIKIGLLKEGKLPIDTRVALTPQQAAQLKNKFPSLEIVCQTSPIRAFKDQEYADQGIDVVEDLSHCDILLGIKEVPVEDLIAGKTYCFFSHTIKEQPYNRYMLQQIVEKKIRLIDYERLLYPGGERVIAFGRYAGIVGAYNTIYTYGQKFGLFDLKRAKDCHEYDELKQEFNKIKLPAIKIVLTGTGRVANGAAEVLEQMKIKKVKAKDFLQEKFDQPVYTQLSMEDYHQHKTKKKFELQHFYNNPGQYISTFEQYWKEADILISGVYWDSRAPLLFTIKDMQRSDFRIKVIGDITCDIDGSIPSTKKPSTIDEPVYDFNPKKNNLEPAYSSSSNISVMAIDNLPSELPRDASRDFGQILLDKVIPALLSGEEDEMIANATITENGGLTAPYQYLHNYVFGH
ncbi:MAG: NAD(P)-dependent oxidoreductase [Cyclobacteriaceae bacterium]